MCNDRISIVRREFSMFSSVRRIVDDRIASVDAQLSMFSRNRSFVVEI